MIKVGLVDKVTGQFVKFAKRFPKAVANAPKAVATVAKTGTVAQKVAMGVVTTGLVAGGATGIILNIPTQTPVPEQKPAVTQPAKQEEVKPAEEVKTEETKPAEDTKPAAPAGHYESVQKSKYVEDGTYTVVTMIDDDGDPVTFTASFGTAPDAQFSTQAEAEAYLNAQHRAFTEQTGRKRVVPGNTYRGFDVGETQTKGHTEYWTEQVWVSGN